MIFRVISVISPTQQLSFRDELILVEQKFYSVNQRNKHKRHPKMNKTLLTVITTAALLPFGATAMADTHASEKTGSDMYVGITVGNGKQKLDLSAADAAIHDPDVSTMSLFVGMDLNETFAIEGLYADHGKSTLTGTTQTVKLSTMGIAVKAGADLTDNFRAFAKVGYHSWKSKLSDGTKDDGTNVLYGIGVEYALSSSTAIVTNFHSFTVDKSTVDDTSIGIMFSF